MLGGGVVIKYNANQRYTTDTVSAAVFQSICRRGGRARASATATGRTCQAAPHWGISPQRIFSVPTVDIGLPQLAMHSVCETAGAADTDVPD